MTATPEPTVFIVDDDRAVRDSLRLLVKSVGWKVQTFASADEFLAEFDGSAPGCLVLDIRMPGMSGRELHDRLIEMGAAPPVIFITGHGDIPMAVDAMRRGAADFITKPFRDQDLLDRIREAISTDAEQRGRHAEISEIRKRLARLTPREKEVMELVVEGKPNKVIAMDLDVSERTVEIHRARVMGKMEADSLPHLVQMALQARGQEEK